ncbi:ABC transporter permease [Hoyosella rhizosphaerae]|uniref:Doxorubicin resistance ABC transporter permease DrrB n=1 Tax=Hoyosella rhizosphaerae TaxID=1755582 RepID=A0A916UM77_9ACTN|nr:ABC transporter permease [Hoyosella rhizosphaerae]MBN4925240.1 ABC transporter permease [Hoyosella rhizosphaerae]GGC77287.1 doxorubicin resistance ABC transporter permease DrrB [Hoyosella rhizosphaerae]
MTVGTISLPLENTSTANVKPSAVGQWAALNGRTVREMSRNGDFIVAILTPALFTLAYYVPLRKMMETATYFGGGGLSNYGQFVVPLIALGAVALTMTQAALRAAKDARDGITKRLSTMPIPRTVPLAARMSANMVRSVVTLAAAMTFGHIINFRFEGSLAETVGFIAFAFLISLALMLGADALGTLTENPRAVTQALTLPTLIFGMMSTGFIPESGFPEFVRPFVRNQPVSLFTEALRALADGTTSIQVMVPALIWGFVILVLFGALAIWASARRR